MKKNKCLFALLLTTGLVIATTIISYAGTWEQDTKGWKYINENGSYATGWIIDNEKYYYLGNDYYMLADKETPDGYFVDNKGEWKNVIGDSNKDYKSGNWNVSSETVSDITLQGKKLLDEAKSAGMSVGDRTQLISVYTNQAIYGNDGIILTKTSDGYTVDIGVRLTNSVNQKGLKELLRLTGKNYEELYNELYNSFEGDSNINHNDYVQAGSYQIKAIKNGNSITYLIK
ncbi:hypothetical protein [Lacrimispora brassicae]